MGSEATPEGGPAARIAASCLGSGYRVFAGFKRCVDTYAAIAVCQALICYLTHRYRRQASSHMNCVLPV